MDVPVREEGEKASNKTRSTLVIKRVFVSIHPREATLSLQFFTIVKHKKIQKYVLVEYLRVKKQIYFKKSDW